MKTIDNENLTLPGLEKACSAAQRVGTITPRCKDCIHYEPNSYSECNQAISEPCPIQIKFFFEAIPTQYEPDPKKRFKNWSGEGLPLNSGQTLYYQVCAGDKPRPFYKYFEDKSQLEHFHLPTRAQYYQKYPKKATTKSGKASLIL